ncbi:MAG: hypothetical protein AAGJ35_03800, partial [Myxococcota bacterium]
RLHGQQVVHRAQTEARQLCGSRMADAPELREGRGREIGCTAQFQRGSGSRGKERPSSQKLAGSTWQIFLCMESLDQTVPQLEYREKNYPFQRNDREYLLKRRSATPELEGPWVDFHQAWIFQRYIHFQTQNDDNSLDIQVERSRNISFAEQI